ncbi:hypothetical protein [Marinobacterium arenosum]|uniref:hypothetical protein n=1 Tax=Marinobacterium arenosum TaxID=2862496 RepID=UPI001C972DD3|nr:hypothetical protein [Marinobacterium arenosum]MBY4678835.1 hypothetical protein [Marinobacterium arenosum]
MSAQVQQQPTATQISKQTRDVQPVVKTTVTSAAEMMRESGKEQSQPRYDFVGIAG